MQKSHWSYKPSVCKQAQESFELWPLKEQVCIYDLIGSNIFREEWTGDNTSYWAIIPAGDFLQLFISNT